MKILLDKARCFQLNNVDPKSTNARFLFHDIVYYPDSCVLNLLSSYQYSDIKYNLTQLEIEAFDSADISIGNFKYKKGPVVYGTNRRKHRQTVYVLDKNTDKKNVTKVRVKHGTISKIFVLNSLIQSTLGKSVPLTMTTLCYKDSYIAPKWIRHYYRLGVRRFIIYYNGIITAKIKNSIINGLKFPDLEVVITEYNFAYWSADMQHHHCQTVAINHATRQYGRMTQYMMYFDLDEYLYIPNGVKILKSVKKIQLGKWRSISFPCHWSRAITNSKYIVNNSCAPRFTRKCLVDMSGERYKNVNVNIHHVSGHHMEVLLPTKSKYGYFLHVVNLLKGGKCCKGNRSNKVGRRTHTVIFK